MKISKYLDWKENAMNSIRGKLNIIFRLYSPINMMLGLSKRNINPEIGSNPPSPSPRLASLCHKNIMISLFSSALLSCSICNSSFALKVFKGKTKCIFLTEMKFLLQNSTISANCLKTLDVFLSCATWFLHTKLCQDFDTQNKW